MVRYKDMEAVAAHRASEAYKALIARAKEEQLLAAPIESRHLEVVGGFDTRT
jgi:quinol monooxygenase YgiN